MAKVAMVLGPEFEDSEFRVPYGGIVEHGHEVTLVGVEGGQEVRGKREKEKAMIDCSAAEAKADDFAALVIPGGHSPDNLRIDGAVVQFVKEFAKTGKTVAAVCHGPQLLIEAEAVSGRKMTSWPSVRKDLINAGAAWVDEEVVEDGPFITSRKPEDLEAFTKALLNRLS